MVAPGRRSFWTLSTIRLFAEKAKNTHYRFEEIPPHHFRDSGLYIHVPFCYSLCRFCPYYREFYQADQARTYLRALLAEISRREMSGTARWLYIGGGTPNVVAVEDWAEIFEALSGRITLQNISMELAPSVLTKDYLRGLRRLGVSRISLGVESFNPSVLRQETRPAVPLKHLAELVETALGLEFWVNTDIMLGFENQRLTQFWQDIEQFLGLGPSQVTLYPLMTIRGTTIQPQTLAEQTQYYMIEQAGAMLTEAGYRRRTLWTWARGADLYDSSYDEMGSEYLGLGPSAISSTPEWVAVNPALKGYLESWVEQGPAYAFVNHHLKQRVQESWRKFGMMLYERRLHTRRGFPLYLNFFIRLLQWSGHSRKGCLTERGLYFAHYLTRAVVETKNFPLQNPACVTNLPAARELLRGVSG